MTGTALHRSPFEPAVRMAGDARRRFVGRTQRKTGQVMVETLPEIERRYPVTLCAIGAEPRRCM